MLGKKRDLKPVQVFDEDTENSRIEAELDLSSEWDDALSDSGFDDAIYNGDRAGLIAAVEKALEIMG